MRRLGNNHRCQISQPEPRSQHRWPMFMGFGSITGSFVEYDDKNKSLEWSARFEPMLQPAPHSPDSRTNPRKSSFDIKNPKNSSKNIHVWTPTRRPHLAAARHLRHRLWSTRKDSRRATNQKQNANPPTSDLVTLSAWRPHGEKRRGGYHLRAPLWETGGEGEELRGGEVERRGRSVRRATIPHRLSRATVAEGWLPSTRLRGGRRPHSAVACWLAVAWWRGRGEEVERPREERRERG